MDLGESEQVYSEALRNVINLKGRVVATFFHTLRNPEKHPRTYVVSEDVVLDGVRYIRAGVYPTAESLLLDPNIPTQAKAELIMDNFGPIARAIPSGEDHYGSVLAICETGMGLLAGPGSFMRDDGAFDHAADVLPPPNVIEAMYAAYADHTYHCRLLENFITDMTMRSQQTV